MVHVHLCAQIRWLALLANVSTNLIQIQAVKISALMNLQTVNIIPSVQLIRMKMDVHCLKHVLELSLLLKKAMAQLLLFGVSTIFISFFDILFFQLFSRGRQSYRISRKMQPTLWNYWLSGQVGFWKVQRQDLGEL